MMIMIMIKGTVLFDALEQQQVISKKSHFSNF